MARSPGRPRSGFGREVAFRAFADAHRDLLGGVALLLVGDAERAERLTSSVLARRWADPTPGPAALVSALGELVRPKASWFEPPWLSSARVQLLDRGDARPAHPVGAELQRLEAGFRAALVLALYAGLDDATTAAVLRTDVGTAQRWVQEATAALSAGRPERSAPARLTEELRSVVGAGLAAAGPLHDPGTDVLHGRQLLARRRLRVAAAGVAAALVAVLLGIGVVRPVGAPAAAERPEPPAASASATNVPADPPGTVVALCDVKEPTCRATVMRDWRTSIARVSASHVDPQARYFTGYSFSYDARYESPSFWAGGNGALGLELFRLEGGATEVYVQVATGDREAIRCGRMTKQRCEQHRFLDGNTYLITPGIRVATGIEVQFSPDDHRVVTAVARNTTRGASLPLTTGDLIKLVADPRLRLPVI